MMISSLPVTKSFPALDALNREAFPPGEIIEIGDQLRLAEQGVFELRAFYDGDVFIGYVTLMKALPTVYVFFLAVDSSLRNRGYGTAALQHIRALYPDAKIVLDLEEAEEDCPNRAQRLRRRAFYLRNDFSPTGYGLVYNGITLELLRMQDDFDEESFRSLLDRIPLLPEPIRMFRKSPPAPKIT